MPGRVFTNTLLTSLLEMRGRSLHLSALNTILCLIKYQLEMKFLEPFTWKQNLQLFCMWVWSCEEELTSGRMDTVLKQLP